MKNQQCENDDADKVSAAAELKNQENALREQEKVLKEVANIGSKLDRFFAKRTKNQLKTERWRNIFF